MFLISNFERIGVIENYCVFLNFIVVGYFILFLIKLRV